MFKSLTPNLMVESIEESIQFYENILQFTTTVSVPNKDGGLQFAILVKDGFTLMIEDRKAFIEEYPVLQTEKVQPCISLYIETSDLDSLYQDLKEKYCIHHKMNTTFYGAREFAILDNSGYVLTFSEAKE